MKKDKENGTAEDLEQTRQKQMNESPAEGGMGRGGTPSSHEAPQGKWHREEDKEPREEGDRTE